MNGSKYIIIGGIDNANIRHEIVTRKLIVLSTGRRTKIIRRRPEPITRIPIVLGFT